MGGSQVGSQVGMEDVSDGSKPLDISPIQVLAHLRHGNVAAVEFLAGSACGTAKLGNPVADTAAAR